MSAGKLTEDEAIAGTIERWQGRKVRELVAKYGVDPRRWYEVWQGKVHPEALPKAYKKLCQIDPTLSKSINPSPSKPRFKVMAIPQDRDQLDLFE
ncbi:hypothetical protein [Pannonibacter sp. SL95]|uniref:hypothetical protein n=1 Tax=Pannonibacter sp. SL95 TaxID=2995153 RepID=UPI0022725257|nr:hypothetical protein [Pannonibacter sp. SL95]MCY1706812.1 hypothetical protein [Pannonibacter sp. SL95]